MREPETSPGSASEGSDERKTVVRHRPKFASDELRKQAALYFASGWGYLRTARALGLPVNTVRDWSRAYKAGKFNLTLSQYVYDEEFKERVTAMRRSGASWREIKEEMGVSPATVMRWMKQKSVSGEREDD